MDKTQLNRLLRKQGRINIIGNYVICTALIVIGVYYNIVESTFLFSFFIAFGIYGIWRILKDHSVIEISSKAPLLNKKVCIENYIKELNADRFSVQGDLYTINYSNRFLNQITLTIYFSNELFLVNAKTQGNGIIDFGTSYRATKKAVLFLNDCYSLDPAEKS